MEGWSFLVCVEIHGISPDDIGSGSRPQWQTLVQWDLHVLASLPQAMLRPPLTRLQRLPGLALQCPSGVFGNLKRVAVNPQRSEEELTKEISLHQQVDMCTFAKTQHNSSSSWFSLGVISPATWAFFLALHYAQLVPP